MIRVLLLVHEHIADVGVSATRNVHALARRIKINAVHALDRRKLRNFFPGRGVHHNHFWRVSGANQEAMGGFIQCPVPGTFTAYRPGGADLPLSFANHLNLAGNRVEYEKRLSGLVHQNLSRAWPYLDISDVLFASRINDSNCSIFRACCPTAVSDVEQSRTSIVGHAIGAKVKMDRTEKVESVAAEYPHHPIIIAGYEESVQRRKICHTLRCFESGNAACPFSGFQIHHFQRAIFQGGDE